MPDDKPVSDTPANDASAVAAVLRENLAELNELLSGVAPDQLDLRAAPGEWSVREIVLHIIHAERWTQPQLLEIRQAVDPSGERQTWTSSGALSAASPCRTRKPTRT